MSWFSEDHKKLYFKALGALYDDVKTVSSSLMDTTGKVLVSGYEKIKTTADYLDKRYHNVETEMDNPLNPLTNPLNPLTSNQNTPNPYINFSYDYSTEEPSDMDNSDETSEINDYIVEMGKISPDVLIKLNKNHSNINKMWVLNDGERILVRGKIASYPYVNTIIHEWFEYKSTDERGSKWYPTDELYTTYRNSSRKLVPINNILFKYGREGYKPQQYHP